MKKSTLFITAISALMLAACGGDSAPAASSAVEEAVEEVMQEVPESVEIIIKSGDDMKYDTKRLEAFEGQVVTLTLEHVGELPIDAMGHNWVLLARGVDREEFAAAAISAKDNGYIPAEREGDVIAYTKMIGGGESASVEFVAPAKGAYDFICTFPGHAGMMNGKFIVK
ncbi:MAG: plastocyanin/azurin family copper-binding protein [Luteibaculaceae bacterium]